MKPLYSFIHTLPSRENLAAAFATTLALSLPLSLPLALMSSSVAWGASPAGAASIQNNPVFKDGVMAYRQHRYTDALSIFQSLHQWDPQQPQVTYYYALCLAKTDHAAQARPLFKGLLDTHPTDLIGKMAAAGLQSLPTSTAQTLRQDAAPTMGATMDSSWQQGGSELTVSSQFSQVKPAPQTAASPPGAPPSFAPPLGREIENQVARTPITPQPPRKPQPLLEEEAIAKQEHQASMKALAQGPAHPMDVRDHRIQQPTTATQPSYRTLQLSEAPSSYAEGTPESRAAGQPPTPTSAEMTSLLNTLNGKEEPPPQSAPANTPRTLPGQNAIHRAQQVAAASQEVDNTPDDPRFPALQAAKDLVDKIKSKFTKDDEPQFTAAPPRTPQASAASSAPVAPQAPVNHPALARPQTQHSQQNPPQSRFEPLPSDSGPAVQQSYTGSSPVQAPSASPSPYGQSPQQYQGNQSQASQPQTTPQAGMSAEQLQAMQQMMMMQMMMGGNGNGNSGNSNMNAMMNPMMMQMMSGGAAGNTNGSSTTPMGNIDPSLFSTMMQQQMLNQLNMDFSSGNNDR